jgi:preprotein translocase subunit SecA
MTGTAKTEEKEFQEIYDLSVVEIPTNVAVARGDEDDLIYKTKEAKYNAVIEDIKERHGEGQPILVGTISVEVSEHLSQLLTRQGIPHNVLNAKQHEREAEIIKDAGEPGAVTIATNMAGRGVDIKLGEGVRDLGGLYVLGTERHEARRIDNQLRGRSGRQGDPGESRFYLSAQDDLVRLFAGDRIERIMNRFKLPDDEPMEQKILSNQIENAQKKVEEQNFVSRKNVLKYDDVMSVQRMVIYEQRRRVLEGEDLSEDIGDWIDELIERIVVEHTSSEYQEEWDLDSLFKEMADIYELQVQPDELDASMTQAELVAEFQDDARDAYQAKEEELSAELMREIERFLILQVVDLRWREHLDAMEYLRDGIHLRAMAQKDPLVEYRSEGHAMFEELGQMIREEVVRYLFHVEVEREDAQQLTPAAAPQADTLSYEHDLLAGSDAIAAAGGNGSGNSGGAGVTAGTVGGGAMSVATGQRTVSDQQKVGRNDPCWCGSGKKFKKCHGA